MKLIALYKQPEDPEAFKSAYFDTHLPLIKKVPGLLEVYASIQTRTLVGETGPYMVAEMRFADKAALVAGLNSPEMATAGKNLDSFAKDQYTLMMAE